MEKKPHDPEEILAIVNENDEVVGNAKRLEVHQKGLFHREAYCYVINSNKQVLLHQRSDSLLWDHSCSGHFPFKEDYDVAIVREFEEELGVKLPKSEFKEIAKEKIKSVNEGLANNNKNFRFVKVFLVKKDIPLDEFKFDKGEVKQVKYFDINGLKKLFKSRKITSSAVFLLEKYIFPLIS